MSKKVTESGIILTERPEALDNVRRRRKNCDKSLMKQGIIKYSPASAARLMARLRAHDRFRAFSRTNGGKKVISSGR